MNANIPGRKYTVLNITDNGNVYVSTDLLLNKEPCPKFIALGGVSTIRKFITMNQITNDLI